MNADPVFCGGGGVGGGGDVDAARVLVESTEAAELLYLKNQHDFANSSLPSCDTDAAELLLHRTLAFFGPVRDGEPEATMPMFLVPRESAFWPDAGVLPRTGNSAAHHEVRDAGTASDGPGGDRVKIFPRQGIERRVILLNRYWTRTRRPNWQE